MDARTHQVSPEFGADAMHALERLVRSFDRALVALGIVLVVVGQLAAGIALVVLGLVGLVVAASLRDDEDQPA